MRPSCRHVCEQFLSSRQYWEYLTKTGKLPKPDTWLDLRCFHAGQRVWKLCTWAGKAVCGKLPISLGRLANCTACCKRMQKIQKMEHGFNWLHKQLLYQSYFRFEWILNSGDGAGFLDPPDQPHRSRCWQGSLSRPPYLSTSKCMAVFVFAVSYKLIVMSWSCCNTSFSRSQHMHNTCPKLPGSIHRSIQNFNALGMAVSSCRTKLNSSRNAMKPWRHAPGNIVLLQKSPECSKKDCVTCSCSEYLRGFHN